MNDRGSPQADPGTVFGIPAGYRYIHIANPFAGPILYRAHTVSTMVDARDLSARGFPPGTIVVAGHQSGGRGRVPGRVWQTPAASSLLFTLVVPADLPPDGTGTPLPILIGLGIARGMEESFGLPVLIKWPNDLICGCRKITGILCETVAGTVLAGIGVNCLQDDFPPELRCRATSLYLETGRREEPLRVLELLLPAIRRSLMDTGWQTEVSHRLYGIGKQIRVRTGHPKNGESVQGRLEGIGQDGALMLRTAAGRRDIYSGELLGVYGRGEPEL